LKEKIMEYRIDGAVTPPGLITSAKTFSLIMRDEGLYIIHTGPASGQPPGSQVPVNGVIQAAAARAATKAVNKRIASKVIDGQARLNETGPEALVQQKHSKLLTPDQISEINIKENLREIVLEIRSSQGKYKFRLPLESKAVVGAIKQRLRP
jgi:hypothetical protein